MLLQWSTVGLTTAVMYCAALCTLSVCVLWAFQSSDHLLRVNLGSVYTLPRRAFGVDNKSSLTINITSSSDPGSSVDKPTASVNEVVTFPESTLKLDNKRVNLTMKMASTSGPPPTTATSVDKSIARHEFNVFLQTLQRMGKQNNGPGYERRYQVLRQFSASQINNFITDFGIPYLNSSTFNQQFLVCTGQALAKAKKPVNITNDGNVVMPKHFQKCKSMSFQKNRKTVALLSFPGSGNSWVRQLLETTTGIYTGTYQDCDVSYIYKGMIGEGVYTDNVIAVKIHFPHIDGQKWFYNHNIIYVVRNPYDTILAEWNRWNSAFKDHDTAHLSTTVVFGK